MRLPARGARLTRWERCAPRRAARTAVCCGVALTCLSACNLGPYYHRPDIKAPAAWASPADADAQQWPTQNWWRGFASDDLDELIGQAQRANDDLRAAIARVHQADAQRRIAGAPLLPALDLDASATRARAPVPGQTAVATGNAFSPILSASYELDFWGKNRAALAAATAARGPAATTARRWSSPSWPASRAPIFRRSSCATGSRSPTPISPTPPRSSHGLKLEQTAGIATALDVAQQETVVATVNATIPPLQQQLRQSLDALAILIGSTPEDVDVTHGSLDELAEPAVRPGLPSELLARRPDVAEAEAQLIAANANIAEARATFFPSISLTASGGYESAALAGLLTPANRVWSLGAGALQPIFHGGALVGQYQLTKGHYEELLADYHKAVISALANVEDALMAVRPDPRAGRAAAAGDPHGAARLRLRSDADARRHHQRAHSLEYGDRLVQRPGCPCAGEVRAPAGPGVALPGTRRRLAAAAGAGMTPRQLPESPRTSAPSYSRCSCCAAPGTGSAGSPPRRPRRRRPFASTWPRCSARTCRCTSRDSAPCRPSIPSRSPRASMVRSTRSRSRKGRTSRRARCWCRSTRGPTRRRSAWPSPRATRTRRCSPTRSATWSAIPLLAPEDLASKQTVDTQRALIAQLIAQVKGDEAAIDNARTQLDYTSITLADRRAHRHPPGRPGQQRPRESTPPAWWW